ncbi:MAG: TonB-dependent receptor [Candidatus Kapabacteria bacterium]|nr:TonB-dependent receptor [Candidatus Kapabacteria bacterium]
MKKYIIYTALSFFAILVTANASTIKGKVVNNSNGNAIKNAKLTIGNVSVRADKNGQFKFSNIAEGMQDLKISGSGFKSSIKQIEVSKSDIENLELKLDEITFESREIEVFSSSRRMEKITEAPSAISLIEGKQIEKANAHGQLTKTLEHLQGIDVVQSGMNDFNVNTRGFNNSINRRVLVLLDGRDPSTPLINLMEWNSLQTNVADISRIEAVRGPGSALYGANAYNGVINIITNAPKDVQGTRVSVTGGEYGTMKADLRHAGNFMDNFYYKINVGYSTQNQDWIQSRDTTKGGVIEYAGLVRDVTGNRNGVGVIGSIDSLINANRKAINMFATARLDYEFSNNSTLISEVGYSKYGGEYFVNQTGRILIPQVSKPFVRLAYKSTNFNAQAHWSNRYTDKPQIVMNAAASSGENSDVFVTDAQWNEKLLDDKLRLTIGASYETQNVRTAVEGSSALLNPDSIKNNYSGVYSQAEYEFNKSLKLVLAGRIDMSTLFETQFSPKAALVWEAMENQTFRLTVNRSFLRPSYSDFQRRSAAGAPANYNLIDSTIAAQFGISKLGLGSLAQLNLGNPKIGVESSMSYELGYKGVVNKDMFITADVYFNQRKNFISNPLGGLAPDVYTPVRYKNSDANDSLRVKLGQSTYDRLSIDPVTGKAALIVAPQNIGLVDELGFELGLNYYLNDNILVNLNYTHLEAEIKENKVATNKILPNSPKNKYNFGVSYEDKHSSMPWDISIQARMVEEFKWIAGFYEGIVPAYTVVNLNAGINISHELRLGINIFNLLDNKHYEIFGGTYLQRYSTANLAYSF